MKNSIFVISIVLLSNCASQDEDHKRYTKSEKLKKSLELNIKPNFQIVSSEENESDSDNLAIDINNTCTNEGTETIKEKSEKRKIKYECLQSWEDYEKLPKEVKLKIKPHHFGRIAWRGLHRMQRKEIIKHEKKEIEKSIICLRRIYTLIGIISVGVEIWSGIRTFDHNNIYYATFQHPSLHFKTKQLCIDFFHKGIIDYPCCYNYTNTNNNNNSLSFYNTTQGSCCNQHIGHYYEAEYCYKRWNDKEFAVVVFILNTLLLLVLFMNFCRCFNIDFGLCQKMSNVCKWFCKLLRGFGFSRCRGAGFINPDEVEIEYFDEQDKTCDQYCYNKSVKL